MLKGLYIVVTVLGTVYGQLVLKWRIDAHDPAGASAGAKLRYIVDLLVDPWVLSVLAAALLAALSWMLALSHFELSRAYPFVGATFLLVTLGSALFFGEALTVAKVAGVTLIVAGIAVASQ